jgi:hypothetical protein
MVAHLHFLRRTTIVMLLDYHEERRLLARKGAVFGPPAGSLGQSRHRIGVGELTPGLRTMYWSASLQIHSSPPELADGWSAGGSDSHCLAEPSNELVETPVARRLATPQLTVLTLASGS